MMHAILVGTALVATSAGLVLQNDAPQDAKVVVDMANLDDMLFTADVTISGQRRVPLVMDTGSYELVAFGSGCLGCPTASTYFNPGKAAHDVNVTDTPFTMAYGSGLVYCDASFASVTLEELDSSRQLFWLARQVDLDVALDNRFAGIFGMGPPASARSTSKKLLAWVEQQESDSIQEGLGDELKAVVDLEKKTTPFLASISNTRFSICLLPGLQQPGKIIFNDQETIDKWVDISQSDFWEVSLSAMKIGDRQVLDQGKSCSAIMDSGTSLIGVPRSVYTNIVDNVEKLVKNHGGCENIENWPDLHFKVGADEHRLVLPPTSYVGQVYYYVDSFMTEEGVSEGAGPDEAGASRHTSSSTRQSRKDVLNRLMPHLKHIRAQSRTTEMGPGAVKVAQCEPMVFIMEGISSTSDPDCQFLFGLPIFREYYVSHLIDTKSGKGSKMAFSTGKADCSGIESGHKNKEAALVRPTSPIKVHPRKIRFPSRALLSDNLTYMAEQQKRHR